MRADTDQAGFTLIELLIVVAIIGIIAAIAIPGLLRARMTANEASAIASLRAITSAEVSYSASCGQGGYATALTVLAAPCGPGATQGYISPDLDPSLPGVTPGGASGVQKSGYVVDLIASPIGQNGPLDGNGTQTQTNYLATAVPTQLHRTGERGFNISVDGALLVDPAGGPAGTTPLQ